MKVLLNLFGAPGAGKSTTATGVFSALKLLGVNAEYVPEVAKDFTWEERKKSLTFQAYIHGKQLRNIERLMGKVDVVVTDSSPLLSSFYAQHFGTGLPDSFHKFVRDTHEQYLQPSLSYFLRRVKPYNGLGRNQTEAESDAIGIEQFEWLCKLPKKFQPTMMDGDERAIEQITRWVRAYLSGRPISSHRREGEV